MKPLNRLHLIAVLLLLFVGQSHASLIACQSPTTLSHVDHAVACEKSTANQDFLNTNPMTVNSEAFYGNSDWVYLKKDDPAGNGQSGTWSLTSGVWSTYANVMLVFKDGNDTTLLGFLLGVGFTSGNWTSPFTALEFPGICSRPGCTTVKNVSHISYYVRGVAPPPGGDGDPPPVGVTEPSPMVLIVMGALGLVLVRRLKLAQKPLVRI